MFIGSRGCISEIPPNTCLKVGGSEKAHNNTLKNLGVNFDTYLTFEKHINKITRKNIGKLIYVDRIKDNLSFHARTISINSLILSSIDYRIRI